MSAICRAYDTPDDADRAVARIIESGVRGEDVRVLMGAHQHDARREAAGGFGGRIDAGAESGSFGGSAGSARGGFAGDASARPEGVFGNADRDVVVTHSDGAEQVRVAGHQLLKGLLMDAGLDDATAETDVRALHHGRILVLVHAGTVNADAIEMTLDPLTLA